MKHLFMKKTANTIWNILLSYKNIKKNTPLLWNAFPLHPHKPGNLLSNRTPSKHEIDNLSYILRFLLNDLFPSINKVIALGRKSEYIIKKLIIIMIIYILDIHPMVVQKNVKHNLKNILN